jgi:hypothetical protein
MLKQLFRKLRSKLVKIDEMVCTNCLDIVLGPQRSKSAEYYNINSKPYCSLSCYYEDFQNKKEAAEAVLVPIKKTIKRKKAKKKK